jgi:hypothetical protein
MYVYVIGPEDNSGRAKIGRSDNPFARLAQLQTGSSIPLRIIHACPCRSRTHAATIESQMHNELGHRVLDGCGDEWFNKGTMKAIRKKFARHGCHLFNPGIHYFCTNRFPGTPDDVMLQLKAHMSKAKAA